MFHPPHLLRRPAVGDGRPADPHRHGGRPDSSRVRRRQPPCSATTGRPPQPRPRGRRQRRRRPTRESAPDPAAPADDPITKGPDAGHGELRRDRPRDDPPAPSTGWRGVETADDGHQVTCSPAAIRDPAGKQGAPMALGARRRSSRRHGTIRPSSSPAGGLGLLLRAAIITRQSTTPSNDPGPQARLRLVGHRVDLQPGDDRRPRMTDGSVDHDVYTGGQVTGFKMAQGLAPAAVSPPTPGHLPEVRRHYAAVDRARPRTAPPPTLIRCSRFGLGECTLSLGPDLGDLDRSGTGFRGPRFPTRLDLAEPGASRVAGLKGDPRRDSQADPVARPPVQVAGALRLFLGDVMAFPGRVGRPPPGSRPGSRRRVRLDIRRRFTGSTPQMSEAAHYPGPARRGPVDGTDPLATLTLVTTDTAV